MKKILIVDDEPNIVMSLEYIFKKENYKVFIARDSAEAIGIIENEEPNILLLDLAMSKVDGNQILNNIKSKDRLKGVKVILLSHKNKVPDLELSLKLGVDKHISKPFSIKKLVKEVKELLIQK